MSGRFRLGVLAAAALATGALLNEIDGYDHSHGEKVGVPPAAVDANLIGETVKTEQIAPTILRLLGLDPQSLDAVRIEGTRVLPGL
jgi:hypothetical protein